MLSRKDVRPKQTQKLIGLGFVAVSIDYRLCPELTLIDGPMADVCDAFEWARTSLPSVPRIRSDVKLTGQKVVAIGWSTGGHLALTLGWTARVRGLEPPQAILAFYCPLDYENEFWKQPNVPKGSEAFTHEHWDICEGVQNKPITAYNVPRTAKAATGGWMAPTDARSRIALHMNLRAQTLPVLLNGLKPHHILDPLPMPDARQIASISPLAQIEAETYTTPTFIVHGEKDDLIPYEQAQRTSTALARRNILGEVRILKDRVHLFDLYPDFVHDEAAQRAVEDGYQFLKRSTSLNE